MRRICRVIRNCCQVSLIWPVCTLDCAKEKSLESEFEEQLVRSCRGGDGSACSVLLKAYAARVFAVCLGVLGHRQDAEDVAQQVLIKVLTSMRQLRDDSRFGPWVFRIAKNMCADLHRRRTSEKSALDQAASVTRERPKEYPQLHEALTRLPEKDRTALMLYYFDGRSARNLARILATSEAAAQARISRARKKLRHLMQVRMGE